MVLTVDGADVINVGMKLVQGLNIDYYSAHKYVIAEYLNLKFWQ